jgi:hypothetical protein
MLQKCKQTLEELKLRLLLPNPARMRFSAF